MCVTFSVEFVRETELLSRQTTESTPGEGCIHPRSKSWPAGEDPGGPALVGGFF